MQLFFIIHLPELELLLTLYTSYHANLIEGFKSLLKFGCSRISFWISVNDSANERAIKFNSKLLFLFCKDKVFSKHLGLLHSSASRADTSGTIGGWLFTGMLSKSRKRILLMLAIRAILNYNLNTKDRQISKEYIQDNLL